MKLIIHLATNFSLRSDIYKELSDSLVADESGRKIGKNSTGYPRKKKTRQTGTATINDITDELSETASAMLV